MCVPIYCTSAPKPLTFDFELPASAGPSSHAASHASDPFFSSRTRARSARLRTLEHHPQSHSQDNVVAIPAADASKFLDMLGRASARVDENSRKRMRALGERARAPKRSSIKGKGRMGATTTRGARSMDELGDHTNFIRDAPEAGVHFSSLPIMLQSQSKDQPGSAMKIDCKDDVQMHADGDVDTDAASAPAPGNDGIKPPVSTRPQNGTQRFPPRAAPTTRHSQKRIEPPSPTPVRSAPFPLRPAPAPAPVVRPRSSRSTSESAPPKSTPGLLSSKQPPAQLSCSSSTHTRAQHTHPIPAPTPLPPATADRDGLSSKGIAGAESAVPMAESPPRHGAATATAGAAATSSSSLISALPPPSQTHGSRRALGMTRSVPISSSNNRRRSVATKKPFRPPIARPASTSAAVRQVSPTSATSSRRHESQRQQRQKEDGSKKGSGADPDSSFDLSFDFDPEALEAAMRKYD
jgi:hypothetical protein